MERVISEAEKKQESVAFLSDGMTYCSYILFEIG